MECERLEQGGSPVCGGSLPTSAPLWCAISELQLFLEDSTLVGWMLLSPEPFVLAGAQRAPNCLAVWAWCS